MQIKLFFVLNQKFLCVYVNVHKFNHDFSCILAIFAVSLFTREWIEITYMSYDLILMNVSLFTREWIEMAICTKSSRSFCTSPSLRGSGLKLKRNAQRVQAEKSPSLRGSGLKLHRLLKRLWICSSPSLRGSGLKFFKSN